MQHKSLAWTIGSLAVALVALSASPALALPEILPFVEGRQMTGKSEGTVSLETVKGETITCTSATGEGEQLTPSDGTFHNHFVGCKSSGFSCNTTGDEAGVILVLGKLHLVWDALSGFSVAVLLEPEETAVKCTALVTIRIKGTELCHGLEPLTVSTTHLDKCSQSEGRPEETTYWNDEGLEMHALLLISKNGGSFIECGELALNSASSSEALAAMA